MRMADRISKALHTLPTSLGCCQFVRKKLDIVTLHCPLSQQDICSAVPRHYDCHLVIPALGIRRDFRPMQTVAVHLGQDDRWRVYRGGPRLSHSWHRQLCYRHMYPSVTYASGVPAADDLGEAFKRGWYVQLWCIVSASIPPPPKKKENPQSSRGSLTDLRTRQDLHHFLGQNHLDTNLGSK